MDNITGEKKSDESVFNLRNSTIYQDVKEATDKAGEFVKDAKNQTFENISFGITLAYVGFFGVLLVYGYNVFESTLSLSKRIGTNGMTIGLKI
jgi:hypothetical protein